MTKRLSFLLVLTLLGCNSSTTPPPGVGDVTLDVVVSRVNGSPTVRAEVRNNQTVAIRHGVGCSFWGSGMQLFFLDASGRKLVLSDNRARPLCPDGIAVLQPDGYLGAVAQLEGTLYTEAGEAVVMRPGIYTAVVGFRWELLEDPNGLWQAREKHVEFRWPVL